MLLLSVNSAVTLDICALACQFSEINVDDFCYILFDYHGSSNPSTHVIQNGFNKDVSSEKIIFDC